MASRVIGKCPVCHRELSITRLKCPGCSTEISGEFTPCTFCFLDPEQERLIMVFLKNRGNIREVERELGISYPTVRARLDEVLAALGLPITDKGPRRRPTREKAIEPESEGEGPTRDA
jgi:hypothetical protein